MSKFRDLTGQRFGRLTAIQPTGKKYQGRYFWLCRCDCGNEVEVLNSYLTSGQKRSCGCLHRELLVKYNQSEEKRRITSQRNKLYKKTHGRHGTRLYHIWTGVKCRCYRTTNPSYKYYGGRGISVCDEWLHDYTAFEKWALENGYDENAPYGVCTIDRIDVDGNYEPSNCRWVTMAENNRNKRTTRKKHEQANRSN